ncbi:MAG: ROK family protein [Candidatus Omnitrophica bacterium]|nr:ROK family protein [Candidatus Omnitrophota bacterium]
MQNYLGIDWGGTYIKSGLVTENNKILKKLVYSSLELQKKEVFIDTLYNLTKEFKNIKAVGIGAPGIIDVKKGFIYYLPNIEGWKNYPLKEKLEKKTKIPVYIDNDANVFALAESRVGAAKDVDFAIFLTLGTGLGGAVLVNKKILKNMTSAAELGHIPISLEEKKCNCGGSGCIETFIGAKYLILRYKELTKKDVKEVKEIFISAQKKEKEALFVWEEFGSILGKFLAGMVNIFNPQKIVLGGGVAGALKIFKPYLWQALKKQVMWPNLGGLKIVKAKLKNAGIIGAAILAKESIKEVGV